MSRMNGKSDWPNWLPIREDLSELSPYGAPQIEVPVRLNTNENPYSPDELLQRALIEEIQKTLKTLNRYPDRDATELRGALAKSINSSFGTSFNYESIWVANGSNEIIQSILLAFDGDVLGFEPSYSMHPLITRVIGKNWISVPRDGNFQIGKEQVSAAIESESAKIIFVTSPNNPTGTSTDFATLIELSEVLSKRSGLLVVDEAYSEFSKERSAVDLIAKHPNILVSRTMSKAFAFAGARLGYLVAHPKVIEALLLVRLPYHLSSISQACALAAISKSEALSKDVQRLSEAREEVAAELKALGLSVLPSDANFLLFGGFPGGMNESEIWQGLLEKGVLVRDVGISGKLRVTIGTRAENRAFLDALSQVIRG